MTIKGLSAHVAATEEDALSLLFEGESNRAIAEHSLNKASSRSHTIFTLSLELHARSDGAPPHPRRVSRAPAAHAASAARGGRRGQ